MTTYIDTKLITLNSLYAVKNNNSFNSDVLFETNGILVNQSNLEKVELSLLHAEIPASFYNINYTNNTLQIFISGSTVNLVIPVGNYDANTLITAIKTALGIPSFTITLSVINGVLTFTNPSSFTIFNNAQSKLAPILGFTAASNASVFSTLIASFPLNLLGIIRLNINSSQIISSNYTSKSGSSNMLSTLPVDVASFGLILYENKSNVRQIIRNTDINQIDIQITDQFGNLVNFNNQDWILLFALFITYTNETKETLKKFLETPKIETINNNTSLKKEIISKDLEELQLLQS